jgi:hypothetical protein
MPESNLPAPIPPKSAPVAPGGELEPVALAPLAPRAAQSLKPATTPPPSPLAKPRVKLAATGGDGVPLGASLTRPQPAPLPDRGAGLLLVLSVLCAAVAAIYALLIFSKL